MTSIDRRTTGILLLTAPVLMLVSVAIVVPAGLTLNPADPAATLAAVRDQPGLHLAELTFDVLGWLALTAAGLALAGDGPRAAVVVDLPRSRRYVAVRGGGATLDGKPLVPTAATVLGDSVVGLSGFPPRWLGWKQYRALGAMALDLCAVADGTLDGYIDCSPSAHGPWDYLGALLVCREAGVAVADAFGRELVVVAHDVRRTPVAGATAELQAAASAARREGGWTEGDAAAD